MKGREMLEEKGSIGVCAWKSCPGPGARRGLSSEAPLPKPWGSFSIHHHLCLPFSSPCLVPRRLRQLRRLHRYKGHHKCASRINLNPLDLGVYFFPGKMFLLFHLGYPLLPDRWTLRQPLLLRLCMLQGQPGWRQSGAFAVKAFFLGFFWGPVNRSFASVFLVVSLVPGCLTAVLSGGASRIDCRWFSLGSSFSLSGDSARLSVDRPPWASDCKSTRLLCLWVSSCLCETFGSWAWLFLWRWRGKFPKKEHDSISTVA